MTRLTSIITLAAALGGGMATESYAATPAKSKPATVKCHKDNGWRVTIQGGRCKQARRLAAAIRRYQRRHDIYYGIPFRVASGGTVFGCKGYRWKQHQQRIACRPDEWGEHWPRVTYTKGL